MRWQRGCWEQAIRHISLALHVNTCLYIYTHAYMSVPFLKHLHLHCVKIRMLGPPLRLRPAGRVSPGLQQTWRRPQEIPTRSSLGLRTDQRVPGAGLHSHGHHSQLSGLDAFSPICEPPRNSPSLLFWLAFPWLPQRMGIFGMLITPP